jgi:hypothetical protein
MVPNAVGDVSANDPGSVRIQSVPTVHATSAARPVHSTTPGA